MFKLYCLSYRFRIRWSFSKKFESFDDAIDYLRYQCKFKPYWVIDRNVRFYKLVCPDGTYFYRVIKKDKRNDITQTDLFEIIVACDITDKFLSC